MQGDDKDAIEAKTKDLTDASSDMAQKMYAEQQAQAGQAGPDAAAEAESSPADDEVVDAEFEEVKEEDK